MASKKKKRKKRIKQLQREAMRAERAQRKRIRHNTAVNQEKHRADWQPLRPNEEGIVPDRRIMPLDETTRRLGVEHRAARTFDKDFDDSLWSEMAAASPHQLGIVVEVSRGLCRVAVDDEILICDIRGILTAEGSGYTNILAVGDRVLLSRHEAERGLVEEVLPRRSGLARRDTFYTHLKQIVAANVDQVLVVASWREPHIYLRMIDEYLIGAARNNLHAILCINKVDLAHSPVEVEEKVCAYADLGYPLIFTSAVTGIGIAELRQVLENQNTVLAGLSGVGKSTLLNAVAPGFRLRTSTISEKRQEGRHTTTQAQMLLLPFGGYVVDTPGIKDMGVDGLPPHELIDFYPDLADVAVQCRFSDCTHEHEPGCAVKAAVKNGRLAPWRLKNYRQLLERL